MVEVTAQEVVEVFQARFPREFEIAVLSVQNAKLQQAQAVQEEPEESSLTQALREDRDT